MAISLVQSHEQALLATRRKVVAHTPVAPDETGQQKQSLPAAFAPVAGFAPLFGKGGYSLLNSQCGAIDV